MDLSTFAAQTVSEILTLAEQAGQLGEVIAVLEATLASRREGASWSKKKLIAEEEPQV